MRSVSKLQALALQGQHGRAWYGNCERALRTLCVRKGWGVVHFAAVLGITSPRVQVPRNARYTLEYMDAYNGEVNAHLNVAGLMQGIRAGLEHYERTGEIRGPKTRAFASAVLGDGDAIVLDVWMARALNVPQARLAGKAVRLKAEARVRTVAKSLGWEPAEVQAAIWTATFEANHVMAAPGLDTYLN